MTDLYATNDQLLTITTPEVLYIMTTIKQIQKRMKEPDNIDLEHIRIYDKLSREFNDFFERYTTIFAKVTRGDNLNVIASALYYKDQIAKGLMTEEHLANKLATTYFPENLKKESDAKLKEMKNN